MLIFTTVLFGFFFILAKIVNKSASRLNIKLIIVGN